MPVSFYCGPAPLAPTPRNKSGRDPTDGKQHKNDKRAIDWLVPLVPALFSKHRVDTLILEFIVCHGIGFEVVNPAMRQIVISGMKTECQGGIALHNLTMRSMICSRSGPFSMLRICSNKLSNSGFS